MPDQSPRGFATTRWSLVYSARDPSAPEAREALSELCTLYWYPLYAFLRRQGYDAPKAEDLTQGFLARLLEKRYLDDVRADRGRFRSFLLTAVKHFALNERDREMTIKRGGGTRVVPFELATAEGLYTAEPRDNVTPETLFERRWAATVLEHALSRIRAEYTEAGKAPLFELLNPYLAGEEDVRPYAELATDLGMTEGAVRVAVHRLKRRFGMTLRALIADTVSTPLDVEEELRHLAAVVRR